MVTLVAFASLPFGLRGGRYEIGTPDGVIIAHVAEQGYNPFVTIASRPELAQSIPPSGQGEGFTSYTWYDHPFVLRVIFGRNVASLGAINSCVTIVRPLDDGLDWRDETALAPVRERFSDEALAALNKLIAVVRRKARLYHVFDLRRDDIHVTVRNEDGVILRDDPLQVPLTQQEQEQTERFDLLDWGDAHYEDLFAALQEKRPVALADDLLIEAERALTERFPRQAIMTCHMAVEAAASALLTRGMRRRGIPHREIDYVLSTKSLTSKLHTLLRNYAGSSLKLTHPALWKAFNQLNDLRNDIVHRGALPSPAEAEAVIATTRELLQWIDVLAQRNR